MQESRSDSKHLYVWLPIVLQTIVILLAAFSYSTAQEHRFTIIESNQVNMNNVIQELKVLNSGQDERLKMLEENQARILALEEYVFKVKLNGK